MIGGRLKQELSSLGLVPRGSVLVFVSANEKMERPDQNFVYLQRFD
jgi:hypothetical protein